jgi:hypothetical protein
VLAPALAHSRLGMSYPRWLSLRPEVRAGAGYRFPVRSRGVRVAARITQNVLEFMEQHQIGGVGAYRLSASRLVRLIDITSSSGPDS